MAEQSWSLLEILHKTEITGKLAGLEIEFWHGGGLPPPSYRSDQLLLRTQGGQEILQFAVPMSDSHFDPPNLHEKWILPVDPTDVRKVAGLLRSTRVFTATYPEEERHGGVDMLSYEILVTAEGRREKRKYYYKLPEQLRPLQDEFERLIELVKTRGRRGIYHQGKEIQQ